MEIIYIVLGIVLLANLALSVVNFLYVKELVAQLKAFGEQAKALMSYLKSK